MAKVLFCGTVFGYRPLELYETLRPDFVAHSESLSQDHHESLEAERIALGMDSAVGAQIIFKDSLGHANAISDGEGAGRYDLFVRRYGGSYISFKQAIEFDSLRRALDIALARGAVGAEEHLWAVVALCVALAKCATTTGHFAQPLLPKDTTFRRYKAQRSRSMRLEWYGVMEKLKPAGHSAWRAKNRAYCSDSLELIHQLAHDRKRPSVIYADPPYTKDQYSRYYHLYETALRYDYPVAKGRGLYRNNRPASAFSARGTVLSAFDDLIRGCASIGADLIISYPKNGILESSFRVIPDLLLKHYRKAPQIVCIEHAHSTMGASKGTERHMVTEVLFRASKS
jgi:adenine-specific DNA-methyltransferase